MTTKALDITQRGLRTHRRKSAVKASPESGESETEFYRTGEGPWTKTPSNPDFVLTPDSGEGDQGKSHIPAKTTHLRYRYKSQYSKGYRRQKATGLPLQLSLLSIFTLIAEWQSTKTKMNTPRHGVPLSSTKSTAGFIDAFANPTTGIGSIRLYNSDENQDALIIIKACAPIPANMDSWMIRGCVTTDYWLMQ